MWITARLVKAILHPSRDEFHEELSRLERHSAIADQTAVATELLRASKFREGDVPFTGTPLYEIDLMHLTPDRNLRLCVNSH